MSIFKNRIIEFGVKPASQFTANPNNPREHPEGQRRAVRGSLEQLGWIGVVVENVQTGNLVDGHERLWQSLDNGDDEQVPFLLVDLTPEEEALALATLDYTGELATYNNLVLEDLFGQLPLEDLNNQVKEILSDMEDKFKLDLDMPEIELGEQEQGKKKTTCPKCGHEF